MPWIIWDSALRDSNNPLFHIINRLQEGNGLPQCVTCRPPVCGLPALCLVLPVSSPAMEQRGSAISPTKDVRGERRRPF